MKKSLFAKYFTVCTAIILLSFLILGSVFSVLIARYLKNERQQLLSQNLAKAAVFTVYNYESNGGRYLERRSLRQFYSSLADTANGVMFYVDDEGNTLLCTEASECSHLRHAVPKNVLVSMEDGTEYREYGRLGGIYSSMHYTVGCAVLTTDGHRLGYLFCSTAAGAVTALIGDVVRMFLLASFVAILLSGVITYALTQIMARPMRQMSKAAKSFGEGDFSARISYHSQDELGELAQSFNQMADSLSELESTRKNFIANVSHELKTPMTTIGGFIDGILDGTIPHDRQEHYLQLVSDEVRRLSRLVRAMLSIAKIESGEISLNAGPVDINNLIFTTLFSFENRIEEKKIDVRGLSEMEKCVVLADEDLIHQVVYNLIDNAVKFCNENGYIEFSSEKRDGRNYIHVKNSGGGLSRAELMHVFDRFYKTDKSRSLDKNGVGLGLHIVKTILEMHGGDISVGSVQGEYTEFIFGLPLYVSDDNSSERRFLKK